MAKIINKADTQINLTDCTVFAHRLTLTGLVFLNFRNKPFKNQICPEILNYTRIPNHVYGTKCMIWLLTDRNIFSVFLVMSDYFLLYIGFSFRVLS